jgi:hypothetical protein
MVDEWNQGTPTKLVNGSIYCSIDPLSADWQCNVSLSDIAPKPSGSPAAGSPVPVDNEVANQIIERLSAKLRTNPSPSLEGELQVFEFETSGTSIKMNFFDMRIQMIESSSERFKNQAKHDLATLTIESIKEIGL